MAAEDILNEELFATIVKRKSIRKYDLTPLDGDILAEIATFVASLRPLDDTIKTEMRFVLQKDVKNLLPIKAPHYIVAFSENTKGYLVNIGFMLQQLDLFLSAKGIGACWQGIPRPTNEILDSSALEFVIVMSFGKPKESLYRESSQEFKRKPLGQVTTIVEQDQLFEPVRLAPSATNSQPWFFLGNNRCMHAYCVKSNFLKALIYKKMNQIDMGIALFHLWLSVERTGKTASFIEDEIARANPPTGYYYIGSIAVG